MMDEKFLRDDGGEIAKRCDGKIGIGDGLMIVDDRLMSKSTRDVCPMCKAHGVIILTIG